MKSPREITKEIEAKIKSTNFVEAPICEYDIIESVIERVLKEAEIRNNQLCDALKEQNRLFAKLDEAIASPERIQ